MKLHTVVISYNRLELTKQAIESYLDTVTVPFTLLVVDNGSDEEPPMQYDDFGIARYRVLLLEENRYPGFAANRGFEYAPADATHFHRADNDFRFLPGWCDEVERRFANKRVGQLGLRTNEEELFAKTNVGGNMIIRREVWDAGVRYDERPWPEIREAVGPGYSEDSFLSPAVEAAGWIWRRVEQPCIESMASGDWSDPYYQRAYSDRGIVPGPNDPTA